MKRHLLLIGVALLLVSCNRQKEDVERTITPVTLAAAEEVSSAEDQMYSASILPNRQVSLAFRVNGFVEEIRQVKGADGRMRPIDIGDLVKRGTVLAQVRVKDYQLQVSQADGQLTQAKETEAGARAQLQQAQAAATKAAADYQRAEALYQKKSLTKSDYDGAKANYDSTQAQVKAAHAQVQATGGAMNTAQAAAGTAGLSLTDTSLIAPFDGAIAQRSIELGMLAGPSVSAFVLADISSVKATFGVSDLVVARLKRGSKMTVFAEAFASKAFRGFVSALAPVADSSTRSFQVEVTIANPGSLLKPGMIVSLDLGEGHKAGPVTVVPLDAIVRDPTQSGKFSVVVLDGEKVRHRPVALGDTYGNRIAITGIEAGTKVVTSGATYVNDGETVKVVP